ncbi:related to Amidase family protein [Ustilago trichophora]|uniref:Related to Amidase family protein n=1 Tax=Ustilago trichophora TaxID=86804 RepID=A0A5C3E5C6_9BASI|nr:related to Amidase family protein [Ustilago trichophora]
MAKYTTSSLVVVLCALLLAYLQGASSTSAATTATTSSEIVFATPHLDMQLYSNDGKNGRYPDLLDASISELQAGLERRDFTSVELVQAYLARIDEVNIHGPGLRAIIETSPVALEQAEKLDQERVAGKSRGALHGIPIVIKDNVATDSSLGMNTTAGSYTLLNSIVPGDSPSIATLRKAGAVILGKANMSVWAQARGLVNQTQGFSPRGGFGTSAYWPGGNPCSSSSGSAVAVAAGLAAASVGSQTSGSIICPASYNNIVGFKPTVGLISRNGVIPISATQDSAGPFGRSVKDVAILLTAMAHHGRDQGDNATWSQPEHVAKGIDYAAASHFHSKPVEKPLQGMRLGYSGEGFFANQTLQNYDDSVAAAYWHSIQVLRDLGATLVEVTLDCIGQGVDPDKTAFYNASDNTQTVLWQTEMRVGLEEYISKLTEVASAVYDLGGIVYFGIANQALELGGNQTDQGFLIEALQTRPNSTVDEYRQHGFRISREMGMDGALDKYNVSAIVSPSGGDYPLYPVADRAQYPVIGVPMGFYANNTEQGSDFPYYPFPNAPTGISFTSRKWTEPLLLKIAHAYEQANNVRSQRKPYEAAQAKSQIHHIVPPAAK